MGIALGGLCPLFLSSHAGKTHYTVFGRDRWAGGQGNAVS